MSYPIAISCISFVFVLGMIYREKNQKAKDKLANKHEVYEDEPYDYH